MHRCILILGPPKRVPKAPRGVPGGRKSHHEAPREGPRGPKRRHQGRGVAPRGSPETLVQPACPTAGRFCAGISSSTHRLRMAYAVTEAQGGDRYTVNHMGHQATWNITSDMQTLYYITTRPDRPCHLPSPCHNAHFFQALCYRSARKN